MVVSVRAVYQEGQLRLLDPVSLAEGQIVDLTIQAEIQQSELAAHQVATRLRASGVLLPIDDVEEGRELSSEDRDRIGALFAGDRPAADLINEDRGLY